MGRVFQSPESTERRKGWNNATLRPPQAATATALRVSFLLYLCIWSFTAIFKNSCELRALRQARAGSRGHLGTVNTPSDHKSQTLPALKYHKIRGVRAEDQVPDKHKTKQAERRGWVPGWGWEDACKLVPIPPAQPKWAMWERPCAFDFHPGRCQLFWVTGARVAGRRTGARDREGDRFESLAQLWGDRPVSPANSGSLQPRRLREIRDIGQPQEEGFHLPPPELSSGKLFEGGPRGGARGIRRDSHQRLHKPAFPLRLVWLNREPRRAPESKRSEIEVIPLLLPTAGKLGLRANPFTPGSKSVELICTLHCCSEGSFKST